MYWCSALSSCPPVDNIWAMVTLWRIRRKTVRTVLCCIVYYSCAQWYVHFVHPYQQLLQLTVNLHWGSAFCLYCMWKVLFLAPSVLVFCLCMKYLWETIEWICAKFTRKTCLVPCSDEFEGQRSRSSGTKKWHFFGPFSSLSAVCLVFGKPLYGRPV